MWRMIAALALSALAAGAQDATGAIEGAVTDAATRQPVVGAQISITPAGTAADAFTDSSGSFRFATLAPNRYGIAIKLAGYRDAFRYAEVNDGGSKVQVTVKLVPLSEIAGQVLDEDGHPVEGAVIYIGTSQRATTDGEGRYRIAELAPGDYQLFCRPSAAWREATLQRHEKTGEALGYADTYYFPGVADRGRAVKTTVAAGVHIGGYDFRLHRAALVEFSGRVLDRESAEPLTTAAVELESVTLGSALLDESRDRRRVDRKAAFQFKLIPPGRYTLLVYRNGAEDMNARAVRIPVDVGAAGMTDAEFRVPGNLNLDVHITAPHPELTRGAAAVLVGRSFGAVLANSSQISVCNFGTACVVRDIPPGEWVVNVQTRGPFQESGDAPHPLVIESVRLGRQNAWNMPVTVSDGGNPPIEIVLTDQLGSISAAVSTEDGRPAEAAVILAFRSGGDLMPTTAGVVRRPAGGRFLLENLAAGDYQVAAFLPEGDMLRTVSPSLCGDRAVSVNVTAGQTAAVALRPCEPPAQ